MRVGVGIGVVNAGMVRGGNMKAPVATARVVGDGVKNSMPVDSLSTTRSKIGSQNRNSNYVLSLLIRNTHTHTHVSTARGRQTFLLYHLPPGISVRLQFWFEKGHLPTTAHFHHTVVFEGETGTGLSTASVARG